MGAIGLAMDLLLGGLLIATIVLAVRLHRKLQGLRGGHDELRLLVEGLNEATRRAQAGIIELRMAAEASSARLGHQVETARKATDELSLLVASADNLADRLARAGSPAPKPADPGRPAADPAILRALKDIR
ncbi:DUF6468 domain-containing protein [Zavarzinia compransoris]|uniref:DUF6468 domain-containing protein n=1 Tax=Zavarzinia compransoris TaxID=1264899 RepID=A0A317DYP0_9PROT|nr:DUF6468 domain-containing protein [Zavarzinia compransoris]PWR19799.1 hypothetical protein DKG75_15175 [Zavarzinia compransoris]TDP45096.1 hypothetical protein DES42_106318 [Zavarzinia compransoris]